MTETNDTTALSAPERRITLEAAAKRLGVAKRTVERICKLGQLTTYKGKPAGARQITRLVDPVEVTRIKHEMQTGKFVIDYGKGENAVSRRDAVTVATSPQLAAFDAVSSDPWLNLKESSTYLRLPATYLADCITRGELPARNLRQKPFHSWRIKRSALDALPGESLGESLEKANYRAPGIDRDVALGIVSGD